MTRHIFAGSEAGEPRSPGRAGPRRLRPPASTPSGPAASGATHLWQPAGAPTSQLRRPGHGSSRPFAPCARGHPQPPAQSPSGTAGTLLVGHRLQPHSSRIPVGAAPPRPAPAQAQRLQYAAAAAAVPAPATDGRSSRLRLPRVPAPALAPPRGPGVGASPAETAVRTAAAPSPSCCTGHRALALPTVAPSWLLRRGATGRNWRRRRLRLLGVPAPRSCPALATPRHSPSRTACSYPVPTPASSGAGQEPGPFLRGPAARAELPKTPHPHPG